MKNKTKFGEFNLVLKECQSQYVLEVLFRKQKLSDCILGEKLSKNSVNIIKGNNIFIFFFYKNLGYYEFSVAPMGTGIGNNSTYETKVFDMQTGKELASNSFRFEQHGEIKIKEFYKEKNQIIYETKKSNMIFDINSNKVTSIIDIKAKEDTTMESFL